MTPFGPPHGAADGAPGAQKSSVMAASQVTTALCRAMIPDVRPKPLAAAAMAAQFGELYPKTQPGTAARHDSSANVA